MAPTRSAETRGAWPFSRLAITLIVVGLPLLVLFILALTRLGHGYAPEGDDALIEMHVRDIGHHAVLVGAYSRLGWYHPGPALVYLLWLPYQLTGHASISLSLTAILVNVLSGAGIVTIVYRRSGPAASAWASVVLLLYFRALGASAIQDYWNPTVSILPFALYLISAWSVLCGDQWLLPVALGLGSFVVQCHVGFALPVAIVGLIVITLALRRAQHNRSWRGPLAVTTATVFVLWIPPVIDEFTSHPGNLTALVRYARATGGSWPWREAGNAVLTQLGRIPAWLAGRTPIRLFAASPTLPVWPGLLTVAALVVITVLALRRRHTDLLWLVVMVAVAGAAAVVTVKRIDGVIFDYLVDWISSIGLVVWVGVGVAVFKKRWEGLKLVPALTLVALAVSIGAAWNAVAAPPFRSETSADINHLARAARHWVGSRPAVAVDFGQDRETLVGTLATGTGVALQLERYGISAKVDSSWRLPFGAYRTVSGRWTGPRLVVGTADQPPPGSERIASSGRYVLYAISS